MKLSSAPQPARTIRRAVRVETVETAQHRIEAAKEVKRAFAHLNEADPIFCMMVERKTTAEMLLCLDRVISESASVEVVDRAPDE